MIERIAIKGYRLFEDLYLEPRSGVNIIVGDNESGKSTLLEAMSLALTGRVNGRWAQDELNPYWFNQENVREFFESQATDSPIEPPEILIELYLTNDDDSLQLMRGVHNSRQDAVPGIRIRIAPSRDYAEEFSEYLASPDRPNILPVEYYEVEWRDFADAPLKRRPKNLGLSVIDSRTIRSTSGVDFHTREMLADFVQPKERAAISVAHRGARHSITQDTLATVNTRIAAEATMIHDRHIGLQMDQSANAGWESSVVPQVADIPFAMSGQGQQAAVKVALAMNRSSDKTAFVLAEEPENHLSHTSLTRLVSRIESLAGDRQVFLTTHSSYVLNRLGLDKLRLLHDGKTAVFADLLPDTVRYFKRLSGYDTLRLVLARKVVLVEGPSDEMVFERAFKDMHGGSTPISQGIDVISMRGVAFARGLQLCAALGRPAAVLRDNDGQPLSHWEQAWADHLEQGSRQLFVGAPEDGNTLETQLLGCNGDEQIQAALEYNGSLTVADWMSSNKTEAALRISESAEPITFPQYIVDAVEFVSA